VSPATLSRILWYSAIAGLVGVAVAADWVDPSPATFGILLLCAALEFLDSSLGMGYGTTLTPVLLFFGFEPIDLVPTILISEFLSGFASAFFHSEAGNVRFTPGTNHLRAAMALSLCSLVGVLLGVKLVFEIPAIPLRRLIGAVILGAGLYTLLMSRRTFHFGYGKIVVLALIASFNKALSGGGYGPLLTSGQILSGVRGRAAVAITSLAEGFTCLAGSVLFLVAGKTIRLELLLPVVAGALLSVPLSAHTVRHVPEAFLRRAIAWLTIGMGTVTILKTL
jgi:uncharacterized membrane protein YfcA